jgi:hypothetical protein
MKQLSWSEVKTTSRSEAIGGVEWDFETVKKEGESDGTETVRVNPVKFVSWYIVCSCSIFKVCILCRKSKPSPI